MSQIMSPDLPIELDDFDCICDTAGYAIGYWAREAILGDTRYIVIDDEDGREYTVTPELLQTVMIDVALRKYDLHDGIVNATRLAVFDKEYGEIDSDAADVLIQIACFGEVVYG